MTAINSELLGSKQYDRKEQDAHLVNSAGEVPLSNHQDEHERCVNKEVIKTTDKFNHKFLQKQDKIINDVKINNSNVLDLTNLSLPVFPDSILELNCLQNIYLEKNNIKSLPNNFFECLSNLVWLDLRQNYLKSLPNSFLRHHKHLKTLLLEGNQLSSLPLELGLVKTITGLNITNNPIEFPPIDVIEKGVRHILQFLYDSLETKNQEKISATSSLLKDLSITQDCEKIALSESDEDISSNLNSSSGALECRFLSSHEASRTNPTDLPGLVGPIPHSASLHKPISYFEKKRAQIDHLRKSGAFGTIHKSSRKKTLKKNSSVNLYPHPPSSNLVNTKFNEERRIAKIKESKEKQNLVLQRRKDDALLKSWREESKVIQQRKLLGSRTKLAPIDVAQKSPFDIDKEHLKMMTNEQRIAHEVKARHEKMRSHSSGTRHKFEKARTARDLELEKRIKSHTIAMRERREKPKGTEIEEMAAALKELQVAESLQREVEARRKALEYRFTAFTGDIVIPSRISNTN